MYYTNGAYYCPCTSPEFHISGQIKLGEDNRKFINQKVVKQPGQHIFITPENTGHVAFKVRIYQELPSGAHKSVASYTVDPGDQKTTHSYSVTKPGTYFLGITCPGKNCTGRARID